MADGRMLKRSIATSEQLERVSLEADYLFMRCVPFLDVEGRMAGAPGRVRALVCPLRAEMTTDVVQRCLGELHRAGLVVWYDTPVGWALTFPGFARHNHVRRDKEGPSKIPAPPDDEPSYSGSTPGVLPDLSTTRGGEVRGKQDIAPSSSRDLPTEQRGESGATSAPESRSLALFRPESLPVADEPALPATRTRVARAKTPPRSGGEITAALSAWIDDTRAGAVHRQRADDERRNLAGVVFVYWQSVWQKPDAMLDEKREKLIVDRLRENGNNLDELLHAIDGGKRNTFAKGRGGALRLLLGDRGAVEEFAGEVGTRRLDPHPRADALRRALAPAVATPTEVVLHA